MRSRGPRMPFRPPSDGNRRKSSAAKQRHARRESMQKVPPANGAEFALGEEAGDGNIAEAIAETRRVVVRLSEEPSAATVAGE